MAIKLNHMLAELSPEQLEKVETRTEELVKQHLILKEIREHAGLTQKEVAKGFGVSQANISQLEKRNDPNLSLLQEYVGLLGGKLSITVDLPDGETVQFADLQV